MFIREMTFAELFAQAGQLFAENHRETGGGFALEIDVARFTMLEQQGGLITVGLFDEAQCVGYSVAYVSRHMHEAVTTCTSVALFVAENYRAGGRASDLMAHTKIIARSRGAMAMVWHARKGSRFALFLASKHDRFREQETVYVETI